MDDSVDESDSFGDGAGEGMGLLERLLSQPPMPRTFGQDQTSVLANWPISGGGISALHSLQDLVSTPGMGGSFFESNRSEPSEPSDAGAQPRLENGNLQGAERAVGTVGKEGVRGAWGIAKLLGGSGASNGSINALKDQLLTLNPELVGPVREGQRFYIPDTNTGRNSALSKAADRRYLSSRQPAVSQPGAGSLLWDPAGDQDRSWERAGTADTLPSKRLTRLSSSTPDLRGWRDMAVEKIAGIEARMGELGWGMTPAARTELARLNSERFHLSCQLEGLDTQVRDNTPFSDWTAQEKEDTLTAALTTIGGVFGGGRATSPRRVSPSDATPKTSKASLAEVEQYVAGLKTLPTPTKKIANLFEIEQTGPLNYRVTGGGAQVDADGYKGTRLLEAKHVGKVSKSPYVDGSEAPSFLRNNILSEQHDEFQRYGKVIGDPAVPFDGLTVLTNESAAVPYFQRLLDTYEIPGQVNVVPTSIGRKGQSK